MKSRPQTINWNEAIAELVAMMFFVYVGCGSAATQAGNDGWILGVSLQFGLAITVLAYATAHISGGQINCAVTFALVSTAFRYHTATATAIADCLLI